MMQKNKYNIVHFWVDDNYDNSTFLTIQFKPQSELRLYMEFKSSAIPVAIAPQQFKTFIRKGFAVVEWGGADLDINKTKVQELKTYNFIGFNNPESFFIVSEKYLMLGMSLSFFSPTFAASK